MANEIDLYQDLENAEKMFETCKTKAKKKGLKNSICRFWKEERSRIIKEIKEKYPDLMLGKD